MKRVASYGVLALLWCLHWLPLPVLRAIGAGLGRLLFVLVRKRREVALTNLRLCFPEMDEAARHVLARRHFVAFCQAALDRTYGWWASRRRVERIIRIHGVERLRDPAGRPVIMLAPLFF